MSDRMFLCPASILEDNVMLSSLADYEVPPNSRVFTRAELQKLIEESEGDMDFLKLKFDNIFDPIR